jgi:hypothetical protein
MRMRRGFGIHQSDQLLIYSLLPWSFEVNAMEKGRREQEKDSDRFVDEEDKKPEDIYDEDTRQEMLEDDEITAAEEGFMRGWEGTIEGGKKAKKAGDHQDTVSVKLVEGQYDED